MAPHRKPGARAGHIRFMDIENIHVMRKSYQALTAICLKVHPTDTQFWHGRERERRAATPADR